MFPGRSREIFGPDGCCARLPGLDGNAPSGDAAGMKHQRLTLWVSFVFLAACGGCPNVDEGTGDNGIVVVKPGGGIYVRDGFVLNVPSGAVEKDVTLTVTRDDNVPDVAGRVRIGPGYRVDPPATTFKTAITVYLPYADALIPQGSQSTSFDVRRNVDGEGVVALSESRADTGRGVVEGKTERLGHFWATSPNADASTRLEVDPTEATMNVGESRTFATRVIDPVAGELPNILTSFSIAPARVASVNAHGQVQALAPGVAQLTVRALSLVTVVTIKVNGTATGPRTFRYENPFPTGNVLQAGTSAVGGGNLFAGGNGTVLRFDGSAWSQLFSSPGVTWTSVASNAAAQFAAVGTIGTAGMLLEVDAANPSGRLTSHPTILPQALWSDGTHGMAVGSGSDVLLLRAGAWTAEYSPSFETLRDVEGDGAGNFVTVGNRGSIYRYDGAAESWTSLYETQLDVLLDGAALVDPTGAEAWAVGGGRLWHFQGSAWTSEMLPGAPAPALDGTTTIGLINGLPVIGGRVGQRGWALVRDAGLTAIPGSGTNDTPVVLNGWLAQPLRRTQIPRAVFAESPASTGFLVGDNGSVWRYAAGAFTELSSGEYGDVADVFSFGEGLGVAALNVCANDACSSFRGRVLSRQSSGAWTVLGDPAGLPDETIHSVFARSTSDVLAGTATGLWRFDGTTWTEVPLTGTQDVRINDITACGDDVWAVGDGGIVLRSANGAGFLAEALGSQTLYSVHCPNPTSVWIAGDYVIYENRSQRFTSGVFQAPWRTVWSPGSFEGFAFGDAKYGLYWDNITLRPVDEPAGVAPDVVTGSWGSSIDNFFIVGFTANPTTTGFGLRHNGTAWSVFDTGTSALPTSLHGSSATELLLGTRGGGLLRSAL